MAVAGYREHDDSVDREVAAMKDLVATTRVVRRRLAFPVFVLAVVAGALGLYAHVSGVWSVLGRSADGSYFIFNASVILALGLPMVPPVAVGVVLYRIARARARRAWRERHRDLDAQFLALTERRVA